VDRLGRSEDDVQRQRRVARRAGRQVGAVEEADRLLVAAVGHPHPLVVDRRQQDLVAPHGRLVATGDDPARHAVLLLATEQCLVTVPLAAQLDGAVEFRDLFPLPIFPHFDEYPRR